jgi:hypothetical protein
MLACGVALAALTAAPDARAEPVEPTAPVTAEARASAAREFAAGEAAFGAKRYAEAADHFEAAWAAAPHPNALLNAIDAAEHAGQAARAANLAARLLRHRGLADADRAAASQHLERLSPKLARIDVAVAADALTLDGVTIEAGERYVDPGAHVLVARFGERRVERRLALVAGAREAIALDAESGPGPGGVRRGPSADANGSTKPLGPAWFVVFAGATAVSGGVLVWSAIDTRSAYDAYLKHPTDPAFAAGQDKRTRTNVLVVTTAALGATTVALGLFAVDWGKRDARAALGIGPLGARVTGRF